MHQPETAVTTRSHRSLSSWLACTSARSFPQSASLPPINRKRCQVHGNQSLISYPHSSPSLLLCYSICIMMFVNVVIFQPTFLVHRAREHRCLTTIVTTDSSSSPISGSSKCSPFLFCVPSWPVSHVKVY